MRRPIVLFALLSVALTPGRPAAGQGPPLTPEAWRQLAALQTEKAARTPAQRKISSRLLYALKRQRGDALLDAVPRLRTTVERAADGRVEVEMRAEVTPGLLAEIVARGGAVLSSHPEHGAVRALLPLAEVEAVAAASEVRSIRPAERPIAWKVDTSEGDVAHLADLARSTFGVDGSGVKVGVLSDGADSRAARQATGDLPAVTVLPMQGGSGDEGTAMLEIVYDLAPGAQLYFATAFNGQISFADNIRALQAAGCEVIVDDVFYFSEPVFQDGLIAQAVEDVAALGVAYFSSAGNAGNLNDSTSGVWEGDFSGIAGPGPLAGSTVHDFGGGTNFNTITKDPPFRITLHWSDASGGSGNDYDLCILPPDNSFVFECSTNVQDGNDDPFEIIDSQLFDDTGNNLVVVRNSGAAGRFIHLNTIRGELTFATDGQTAGHSTTENGFGVAAVDWLTAADPGPNPAPFTGGPANPVELFSSDGPRRIFYERDGTPITPGDFSSSGGRLLAKPDVAAADCVSTESPGFGIFCGTSAAAPHAAAIAALMQENGNLTPDGFHAVFAATSLDIEAAGLDRDSGYGILHARDLLGTTEPASPACYAAELTLGGTPNDGPQVFRACATITWGPGRYDDVTGRAATHIFTDGFESGDLAAWSNSVP